MKKWVVIFTYASVFPLQIEAPKGKVSSVLAFPWIAPSTMSTQDST